MGFVYLRSTDAGVSMISRAQIANRDVGDDQVAFHEMLAY